MYAKLKAHYGGSRALVDYLTQFQTDNPTFGTKLGNPSFYSKTSTESWNDAAMRFWTAYVP